MRFSRKWAVAIVTTLFVSSGLLTVRFTGERQTIVSLGVCKIAVLHGWRSEDSGRNYGVAYSGCERLLRELFTVAAMGALAIAYLKRNSPAEMTTTKRRE